MIKTQTIPNPFDTCKLQLILNKEDIAEKIHNHQMSEISGLTTILASLMQNENINDFQVTIIKPNGQNFNPSPNVQNLGDGIYKFQYTPNDDGVWIEKIKSNSNGDDVSQSIVIENYDLDDIRNQIANLRSSGHFQS